MRSRLRYALVTLIERNFLRKRRREGREEFEFVRSDVRATCMDCYQCLRGNDCMASLLIFTRRILSERITWCRPALLGRRRRLDRGRRAVFSSNQQRDPKRSSPILLLLHMSSSPRATGHVAAPGLRRFVETGLARDGRFPPTGRGQVARTRAVRVPPNGARIAAILQAIASLEFSLGERRAHAAKSFLDDDAAVLAPSSDEESASPRHRAGVASMAWRSTRRFRTNGAEILMSTQVGGVSSAGGRVECHHGALRALRSIMLVERGEVERASAEAAKAVSCEEDQDTPGPYHVKLSSQSPEAVCFACAAWATRRT